MPSSGRIGIPTDRENPYNLKINSDGSIEVLTRLREMFPNEPSPFTVGVASSVISAVSESTRIVDIYNNSVTPSSPPDTLVIYDLKPWHRRWRGLSIEHGRMVLTKPLVEHGRARPVFVEESEFQEMLHGNK